MVDVAAFSREFLDPERDRALYVLRSIPPYVGRKNPVEDDVLGIQRRYREISGENIRREELSDYLGRLTGTRFIKEIQRQGFLFYSLTDKGHDMVEATAETVEI